MPKMTVNGKEVEFEAGMTVLQVCELAGNEIPRFCYHERLEIAGNCRMCLVELEKSPKPIASCAYPAAEGMVVRTNSANVKKDREGVMEFLLINHPLDCPICDQGGECDLQDIAMTYGKGTNRFHENKRTVEDKYMGPLIKTHMTRCIHCTRCVRFSADIAGVEEMGAINRGEHMEIISYLNGAVTSELSGNVTDLCPVGALTAKPYAYQMRPWELTKIQSIDVMDAVGSNIRVDTKGSTVMRILPRLNEEINEEWISDKTRFSYDGLRVQRLDRPYLRKSTGRLIPASWDEVYSKLKEKFEEISGKEMAAIVGSQADLESIYLLKKLFASFGCKNLDSQQKNMAISFSDRSQYLFNTTIAGVESADLYLFIGANPRFEAPMVGARLRKRYLKGGFKVFSIGVIDDQTYPVEMLADSAAVINNLAKQKQFMQALREAKKPMMIIGESALDREDGAAILASLHEFASKYNFIQEDWCGVNLLSQEAARTGALEIGFTPRAGGLFSSEIVAKAGEGKIKLLYLLGVDEIQITKPKDCFIIYQGHHGDRGAEIADIILPGAAYTEKNALYVNLEGRLQESIKAVSPPGDAKEDWQILLELLRTLEIPTEAMSLKDIRKAISKEFPKLQLDTIAPAKWNGFADKEAGKISDEKLSSVCENFYMTDPISRASKTMAACVDEIVRKNKVVA